VRNVARVHAGDVVVVFGVGGIGVNVLQTARLNRAGTLLAVDVNPAKEEVATRFGADSFLIAAPVDSADRLAERVKARAGAPIDVAVECSGAASAIGAAIGCTGWGGTTALVGIPPAGAVASFAVDDLLQNRTIVGSLNGTVELQRDFPAIVAHVLRGDLDLDGQVSGLWPLREIGAALAAVRAGSVIRAVIDHTA